MINTNELFGVQALLDDRIDEERGLSGNDMMQERMLALLVEIGELANETRTFKFWSSKKPSEKRVILEEFIDCMHFLLSIGNYIGYQVDLNQAQEIESGETTTDSFVRFFHSVVEFRNYKTEANYIAMWDWFMGIGRQLGFSDEDIYKSYMNKNMINHQRQAQRY
jgi:dimeric dUTPase (all-alpha-NTP-PPase superfamily)